MLEYLVDLIDAARDLLPQLITQVREATGLELDVVKRPDISRGFIPVSWRWIGERTFGWFNRWRRLSKDYE